jgi:hypothetical protein
MTRHRWGDKVVFPHKSERCCANCGLVKVSRHESEGGRDRYWTEYWRAEEKLSTDKVPACEAVGVSA